MHNTAAHLVDRVLPNLPVRQWVATIPFELRPLAAAKPDVLAAFVRIFVETVFREQRRACGQQQGQCGSVGFVHRAGGSVNLNPHPHVLVLDGVLVEEPGGELRFEEAPPPSPEMLARVVRALRTRLLRWLRRHDYIEQRELEDRSNETAEPGALDGCATIAFSKGMFARVGDGRGDPEAAQGNEADERAFEPKHRGPCSVELDGFNIHAAVRIDADDDEGREKLARYCSRPSIALDRLSLLNDGRIAYRVRHSRRGETHRVMVPLEFMARLAALVPPPRQALVRYFGVLSSHSKSRARVVPRLPDAQGEIARSGASSCGHGHRDAGTRTGSGVARAQIKGPAAPAGNRPASLCRSSVASGETEAPVSLLPPPEGRSTKGDADIEFHAFNVITVHHVDRLLGGELLATGPRLDWARLLRRTLGVDPLLCPHCGSRLRPIAEITERETIDRILDAVGYQRVSGPKARAPTEPEAPGRRPN